MITDGLLDWVQTEVRADMRVSLTRASNAVKDVIVDILAPDNGMSPRRRDQFRRRVWISGSRSLSPRLNVGIARFAMAQYQGQANLAGLFAAQGPGKGPNQMPGQDPFIVFATDKTGRRFYFCVDTSSKRFNALYRIPPDAIHRLNTLVQEAIRGQ